MNGWRWAAAVLIAAIAASFRFAGLEERPMHADEAVLAAKLGDLLESGVYVYDPAGHHGPALLYAARAAALAAGRDSFEALTERTLRIVPALAGTLLALAPLAWAGWLGRDAALFAALFGAVSPALVYYSRYFIPETLLVCFTFGAIAFGYRYVRRPSTPRILPAAVCIGLAYATKETWILAAGAGGMALLLTAPPRELRMPMRHLLAGAFAVVLTGSLLYTSFLSRPAGVTDSLTAFVATYFDRALHDPLHIHPWHFYWRPLLFFQQGDGPVWTEVFLVGLAAIGFAASLRRRDSRLPRFVAWYALFLCAAYTLIPYKTPWNFAGPIQAMTLLAGLGAWTLLRTPGPRWRRALARAALAALFVHSAWLAWRTSFPYRADPRNPYVYAHTSDDVHRLREAMEQVAAAHADGRSATIDVVSATNVWPLPWYLRDFPNVRWWREAPIEGAPAQVILATPDAEAALADRLYETPAPGERELYMLLFDPPVQLRPAMEIQGYIAKQLWDRLQIMEQEP